MPSVPRWGSPDMIEAPASKYVWIDVGPGRKRLVERDRLQATEERPAKAFHVMSDIAPFRSPIDGTEVSSRSQLREHERKHGVYQVGNDWSAPEKPARTEDHRRA